MNAYTKDDPWKIIQDHFDPELNYNGESLMSIGNGRMGQRANFPEDYSGPTLAGSYIAGVYYPDKTRVGWWKNGYPEFFAKVLNAVNWIGIHLSVNGQRIDLYTTKIDSYCRELNMQDGILSRTIVISPFEDLQIKIQSERFYSISDQDLLFQTYHVSNLKGVCNIEIAPYLDFNVRNSDSNYDEDFWHLRMSGHQSGTSYVEATTRKTNYKVAAAMHCKIGVNAGQTIKEGEEIKEGFVQNKYQLELEKNASIELTKFVSIASSLYHKEDECHTDAVQQVKKAVEQGYQFHKEKQIRNWKDRWTQNDIIIEGDVKAQQGIRFNIFQLYQTYSGEDPRLNIGPKGFTGEKYGGSTYWDTEAYCLPFYMGTAGQDVARNLLIYRYRHLAKAIENAASLGFKRGAALYPMVTITGEECHNEWEITFEEIHRNGAMSYAIFDYLRYYEDEDYLMDYGLEVLVAIARFWAQRVNWSEHKKQYVMLGVTGPNEYENNVNNNWYTNYIARWCLQYALEAIDIVMVQDESVYQSLAHKLDLDQALDQDKWKHIIEHMYLPEDKDLDIFLQQDGFLDKENQLVSDLSAEDRPINQNWSWDRILRSPFIKQADVLQGLYFFQQDFSLESIQRNFDYYEPRTVHESSLSPCVHSILAARLGMKDKAYEMYLRTARLDLDNYNNDTEDGCHITSMAGTWMSIVEGFAGMQKHQGYLSFAPFLPEQWERYSFLLAYSNTSLRVSIEATKAVIKNEGANPVVIQLFENKTKLSPDMELIHEL